MVGLPARGKTFISQKVCRYLQWLDFSSRVFNVGNYRRKNFGANVGHAFFDPTNKEASEQRKLAATEALQDMLLWFNNDIPDSKPAIAIYDATNSTFERRTMIVSFCNEHNLKVRFFEKKLIASIYSSSLFAMIQISLSVISEMSN